MCTPSNSKMDIDRDGIGSHCLMAHGWLESPHTPCVLKNTIVIMNAKPGPQHCDLKTLGNTWYNASSNMYGMVKRGGINTPLLSSYVTTIQHLDTFNEANTFGVFFDTCPNLRLTPEKASWKDGLFELPITDMTLHQICSIHHARENRETVGSDMFLKPDETVTRFFKSHKTLQDVVDTIENDSIHLVNVLMVHACTTGGERAYSQCPAPIPLKDTSRLVVRLNRMLQPEIPGYVYVLGKYRRVLRIKGVDHVPYQRGWAPVTDLLWAERNSGS